jgi:hypothetical protein
VCEGGEVNGGDGGGGELMKGDMTMTIICGDDALWTKKPPDAFTAAISQGNHPSL